MINSSFVMQPGISLSLPVSDFDDGALYGALVVTLAQEGLVFFNDERTTIEGLGAAFAQAVHEDPEARLIVEADARVEHGALVSIYDMATAAGLQHVTLATRLPVSAAPGP
jgi:biopolymer transport protein ExbD